MVTHESSTIFTRHYHLLRTANTSTPQFNLLYNALHFYLTQLTPTLIASISELVLTNYLQYKHQTVQHKLYKALVHKHIKYLSYYFNVYKRNTLSHKQPSTHLPKRIRSNNSMPNIRLNATKLWDSSYTPSNVSKFINRQNKYKHISNNEKEKIFNHYEAEYNAMCPFNPKLHKSPHVHQSAHHRLHKRNDTKKGKDLQQASNTNHNKTLDRHKIEQLYEDYKLRQTKQRNLACRVDLERGYTYTPDIGGKGIYTTKVSGHKSNVSKPVHSIDNIIISDGVSSSNCASSNKCNKDSANVSGLPRCAVREFSFIYDYIRSKTSFK